MSVVSDPKLTNDSFMIEGRNRDDGYYIVEDELLDVAHAFTQHLHHAEYLRMKKAAKSRTAATLNTILNPLEYNTKMPEETKRKLASVARSKKQAHILNALRGKGLEVDVDDVSDASSGADVEPWVGTTLHGLMESPRKSAMSLARIKGPRIKTRACAGHRKHQRANSLSPSTSPRTSLLVSSPIRNFPGSPQPGDEHASSSEDDDLDAPIQTPPFSRVVKLEPQDQAERDSIKPAYVQAPPPRIKEERPGNTDAEVEDVVKRESTKDNSRLQRRLAQARLRNAKQEKPSQSTDFDDVPIFIG